MIYLHKIPAPPEIKLISYVEFCTILKKVTTSKTIIVRIWTPTCRKSLHLELSPGKILSNSFYSLDKDRRNILPIHCWPSTVTLLTLSITNILEYWQLRNSPKCSFLTRPNYDLVAEPPPPRNIGKPVIKRFIGIIYQLPHTTSRRRLNTWTKTIHTSIVDTINNSEDSRALKWVRDNHWNQ